MNARIEAANPPYEPRVAEDLEKLMPPGMQPLGLFRTVAKNPRVLRRLRKGGLLDPGSITVRQRELVILRTTARAGAEYEWGVHARFFGTLAGLDATALAATVHGTPDAPCWTAEDTLLIEVADALHERASLSDPMFARLRTSFAEDQIIEIVTLAGLYRTVSYLVNALEIAREPGAMRFPASS